MDINAITPVPPPIGVAPGSKGESEGKGVGVKELIGVGSGVEEASTEAVGISSAVCVVIAEGEAVKVGVSDGARVNVIKEVTVCVARRAICVSAPGVTVATATVVWIVPEAKT
jgi:hypothetical protein